MQQPTFAPQPGQQTTGAAEYAGQQPMGAAQGVSLQQPTLAQAQPSVQAPPVAAFQPGLQSGAQGQQPAVQSVQQPQQAQPPGPVETTPSQLGVQPSGQQPMLQSVQVPSGVVQSSELAQGVQQPFGHGQEEAWTSPFVDVLDSPEAITVFADLPGCGEDDIQLKASGNTLVISATRPEEEVGEDARPLQRERRGRIERTITLPVPIDVDEAEASFEDGVCKITLPKSEEERQQAISFQ